MHLNKRFRVWNRNGLGLSTGIDLDALADTGDYICEILGKASQSKAAVALLAKRESSK